MNAISDELKKDWEAIPHHWAAQLEPRKTYAPDGHHSFKCVAGGVFRMLGDCLVRRRRQVPLAPTQISALSVCYRLAQEGVPVYYVDENFIQAVAQTDLPADFLLSEIKWPRDACVFSFPEQFMERYLGVKICYVWATSLDGSEVKPPEWYDGPSILPGTLENPRPKVSWFFYHTMEGGVASGAASYFTDEPAATVIGKYGYTEYTEASYEVSMDNKRRMERLSALLLKLLLVYTTRPSFAQAGVREQPARVDRHTGRQVQKETWSPNFIGRGYRITLPASGTHASPTMHVRRRHFAYVAVGKRGAPDFVSSASLPRSPDGEIDWTRVEPAVREAFTRQHRREWIDTMLVGAAKNEGKKEKAVPA